MIYDAYSDGEIMTRVELSGQVQYYPVSRKDRQVDVSATG